MDKQKMLFDFAKSQADMVIECLQPFCERIEIAGSIRRKSPYVGDIEICAIPKMLGEYDMFGTKVGETSLLDGVDYKCLGRIIKGGSRYKQIEMPACSLDLFIVTPPAQWGVIFMIRTGPADFSKNMVTSRKYGGRLPSCYRVEGGAVWKDNKIISMDDERDYFSLCEIEYIEPARRAL